MGFQLASDGLGKVLTQCPWWEDKMAAFHFLRPEWLWGLLPLVGFLVFLAKRGANVCVWESVCDAHLLPHVLVGETGTKSRSPIFLLGLGWTLALVALAGPVWSQLPQPVFRTESALVMLLDVSRSMDAQDLAPSRLTRAKHKILDILQARQEGQTALVIFSGEAFVVSPLTDDARTMKTLVQKLETNLMPVQGSRPDLALKMGNELLEQAGIRGGDLLLVWKPLSSWRVKGEKFQSWVWVQKRGPLFPKKEASSKMKRKPLSSRN
jgi:Ca-activated chloride channel family protein